MSGAFGKVWRLLKAGPLDLLSSDELFELAALGTDDPDIVAHHLGESRLLTSEEAEEISWRGIDAQEAEGESSHPEGISHRENVKQYEESGKNAHNWGYNVPEMQFGDKEVGTKPTIGPGNTPIGRRNYESPQIIGNMPWPQGFTTENKGETMDMAFRLLKEQRMSMAEYQGRTLHPGDSVAGWAERNIPDRFAEGSEYFDDENSRIDWDEPIDESTSPAFPAYFSPKEAADPAFKPVIEEMQSRMGSDLNWMADRDNDGKERYPMPKGPRPFKNLDLDTIYPMNQYPSIRSRRGRYFTKLPVHGVADKNKDRGKVDDEFSFQGIPFNEDTGFTTGEPMDIAFQLLKAPVMSGRAGFPEDDPDYLSPNDQMWNDEADKDLEDKTHALWDYAEAQGIDPALMFDAWHDRASSVEGLDYDGGKPDTGEIKFRAHAVDPSEWKKLASEPMEIAPQLLKAPVMPGRDPYHLDEDEQIWHDEADEDLRAKTNDLMSYLQNLSPEEKLDVTRAQGDAMLNNNLEGVYTCKDGKCGHLPDDEQHKRNLESADQYLLETMMGSWMPDANLSEDAMEGLLYQDMDRAAFPQGQGRDWTAEEGFRAHAVAPEKWRKLSGEPMDLAWRLLKGQLPEDDPRIQGYREKGSKVPTGWQYNMNSNKKMRDWIHEWLGEQRDEEIMSPYREDEPYARSELEDSERNWEMPSFMQRRGDAPWFGPGKWKELIAEGHSPKIDPWYHSHRLSRSGSNLQPSKFAEEKGGNEAEIDRFSDIAGKLERRGTHPKGFLSAMSDFIPSSSDEPRRDSGGWKKPHEQALRRGNADDLDAMNSFLGLPHENEPVYSEAKVESTDQAGRLQSERRGGIFPDATGGRDWEEEARIQAERDANDLGSLFG